MRRRVSVLVVVVVAAIALAAGVDALLDDGSSQAGSEPEPPSVSTTQPEGPTNYVPPAGEPSGTLYYTNANCELQAIELPRQTPDETPNWDECRFVLSPNGVQVSGAGSGWDPSADPVVGRLFELEGGLIQVSTDRGPDGEPFEGTAPAWRPDGTLTYFAHGAVREWPSGDVVLSQRDLVQALRTLQIPELATRYDRFRVREATWLDERRLAAILSAEGPEFREDMLAIYEGTELDQYTFDGAGGLSELRVSPGGRYAAAKSTGGRDAPGGFVMIEAGRELNTPRIVGYRALAWSPDEQWVAIAGEEGVFVYHPGALGPPELELELEAYDLAWRGEPGAPALVEVDEEAREWLGGVGATGRLFVTQGEPSACRLRALQLPDLVWAERPPGLPNPCRFTLEEDDEVIPENVAPQPGGGQVAVCQPRAVDVFDGEEFVASHPGGCAPAWLPDGRLTFIRDGGLFQGERRLLSARKLGELMGRPSGLEEVAWVDDARFWAVVRSGESAVVALLTTDRLLSSPSFTTQMIEGLRVSATGMVAAWTDQGVVFFDSGGRRALTFPNGQAVTWAPGELIAAVATPNEILFAAPVSGEIVTLPLAVRDLEWVVP
jgi:hypothetical protein